MKEFLRGATRVLGTATIAFLTSTSATALAQTATPPTAPDQAEDRQGQAAGLEDIVVTARRVAESLQETPVAVKSASMNAPRATASRAARKT